MAIGNRHGIYWATAAFLTVVLALGALHGCNKQPKPEATPSKATEGVKAIPAANKEPAKSLMDAAASLVREPKVGIQNIVKAASDRWTPAFQEWWDKPAPDFTLNDIDGQSHKLSDYRGKDVVVGFWGARKLEASQWKDLRNAYSADKLAILSISSEPTAVVKTFATDQGINYTVLSSSGSLPTPFDKVKLLPTTFFVGPDGKFKLAVEGMVPATDAKAILQAQ
jgi:peroxiredoxin